MLKKRIFCFILPSSVSMVLLHMFRSETADKSGSGGLSEVKDHIFYGAKWYSISLFTVDVVKPLSIEPPLV